MEPTTTTVVAIKTSTIALGAMVVGACLGAGYTLGELATDAAVKALESTSKQEEDLLVEAVLKEKIAKLKIDDFPSTSVYFKAIAELEKQAQAEVKKVMKAKKESQPKKSWFRFGKEPKAE